MKKRIRYTIEAKIELDADDPSEISDVLERIREIGEATVINVEVIEDTSLP